MRASVLLAQLGAVSIVSAAAFHAVRQIDSPPSLSAECGPASTVTAYVTITDTPPTVTVAVADSGAIDSSLASAASIDTQEASWRSQLAPISNPKVATTPTFIHTIKVPAFEATEVSRGTSIYYVSVGRNTTNWNYTPTTTLSVEIGVTTVSVLPYPRPSHTNNGNITITTRRTSFATATVRPTFSSPSYGWNNTNSNTSLVGGVGASGTGTGMGTGMGTGKDAPTTTVTEYISTQTVNVTVVVTASPVTTTSAAYNFAGYGPPYVSESNSADLQPRQVCTLVSALIGGAWASWCNNWVGTATLTFTSWETTVTPTSIPGLTSVVLSSVLTAPTSTSSSSGVSILPIPPIATPAPCGEVGLFEIDFDDLPAFSTTNNDTTDSPPIFNPFEHFYWSDDWTYVPPPIKPFPPQSGDQLAQSVPEFIGNDVGSPNAGSLPYGSFGAGPRNSNDHYWFEASSAWVGCDNNATEPGIMCDFVVTGYRWDPIAQVEDVFITEHHPLAPCPNNENCHLQQISFNSEFYGMTTLSFYANVLGEMKSFYIDSLHLGWYNNTCEAGLARISSRKV